MNLWIQELCLAGVMLCAMLVGWQWQRRHQNAGIVDVIWSLGMGVAAIWFASMGQGSPLPRLVMVVCAGGWSLRLGRHLWRRVRESEDGRYRALRERWHGDQRKFLGVFVFQAVLVPLFSLPFLVVAQTPQASPALIVGVLIWLLALSGQSLADRQLDRFRRNPDHHGKTCRDGLWRYSRHPNYFFEWCHWFAYVAMAWGSPLSWLAWSGPIVMFIFLRWVSGIPFTEQQAIRSRGKDYLDYQRHTSAFFPWFLTSSGDSHDKHSG